MTRRLSSWWYALPLTLAVVTVLVGGVLLGIALGGAARTVVTGLDQIERIGPQGLRVVLLTGERRVIAAGDTWGERPIPASVRCQAVAADGQPSPVLTVVRPSDHSDATLEVDGRSWWPMYRLEAAANGSILVTCQGVAPGITFAVGPWFEAKDFAPNGLGAAVAAGVTLVGLLLAAGIAVVLVVLQLTRGRPHAQPVPRTGQQPDDSTQFSAQGSAPPPPP